MEAVLIQKKTLNSKNLSNLVFFVLMLDAAYFFCQAKKKPIFVNLHSNRCLGFLSSNSSRISSIQTKKRRFSFEENFAFDK
jgi:hypothetical protein